MYSLIPTSLAIYVFCVCFGMASTPAWCGAALLESSDGEGIATADEVQAEGAAVDQQQEPVQVRPNTRRVPKRIWVPGQYDRFGRWIPGHYETVMVEEQLPDPQPVNPDINDPGRSEDLSPTAVDVEFRNNGSQPLQVVWVNRSGGEQNYGTIAPGQTMPMQTGHGHLWRFKLNDQVVDAYQVKRTDPHTYAIGHNRNPVKPRFIFTKPDWVKRGTVPGFEVINSPTPAPASSTAAVNALRGQTGRPLQLNKVHHLGRGVVAPNVRSQQKLVIETKDAQSGMTRFWDVTLDPAGNGGWNLTGSRMLPMVSGDPPHIDDDPTQPDDPEPMNYRRPSWVNAQQGVPGGVVKEDPNSPDIRRNAQEAIDLINSAGNSVQLNRVLHAGTQRMGTSTRIYLVTQLADGQIWEIVMTKSGNQKQARWGTLN